ncbi:GyrI-like domain-containing protein [Nonomuraea sp. SMC257]|uniref:GyrI-like domain-containing protein n=1 Tax=Nonomuraea montanisoli TaxID=2741721 RepID=A0A7Y6M4R1_9ACTN|nr:GyrI-like domain-containing protein [Nonomuraea montanisoli]NUW35058.1 GyrI-like domain-containing protein [Nonomuraea montanisoli]
MTDQPHGHTFEILHRDPQTTASIRMTVAIARLSEAQGEGFSELWKYTQQPGVSVEGQPFVRYHTFEEGETDVEVGVPVAGRPVGAGRVASAELPGGTAVATWHLGSHDSLGDTYALLDAWLKEHDREPDGAAWEVYHWFDLSAQPDPSSWPAPVTWRTQLIQPIR